MGVKNCRWGKGTGNREQGTGNRFWATLLFVTCVGFFPFTYLSQDLHKTKRNEIERDFRVNEPPKA
ncbi:MAG: hypothetical protein ACK45Z_21105 [Dolichospermum sp.]